MNLTSHQKWVVDRMQFGALILALVLVSEKSGRVVRTYTLTWRRGSREEARQLRADTVRALLDAGVIQPDLDGLTAGKGFAIQPYGAR